MEAIDRSKDTRRSSRRLALVMGAEYEQVVRVFNATSVDYPWDRSVHELFEEQVRRTPDALAIHDDHVSLTYSELNGRANQLGRTLIEAGAQPGEYIPVIMGRSIDTVIALLAILKVGGAYVPVDPDTPIERQALIVRDCSARLILTAERMPHNLGCEAVRWIDVTAVKEHGRSSENLQVALKLPHPAYVMYTSGSTGTPKGVVVPHHSVNRLVINNGYLRIERSDDCIAHCSNPAFDASTFEVWSALLTGANVAVFPQSIVLETERFSHALRRRGVTVLFQTTALFNRRVLTSAKFFSELRCVLFGGEVADPDIIRRLLKEGRPEKLLHVYGPTETTTFATFYPVVALPDAAAGVPIGRPIANTQVYILDGALQPAPVGVAGEIHIGGPGVASGYLNQPKLTAERFIADPFGKRPEARLYKTGDLGRWRADGNIEFLGRDDQQVKVRGFRIEPGEIEAQLTRHGSVLEAVVVAREDVAGERRLVAYVTQRGAIRPNIGELRAQLKAKLPEYMVPGAFVVLDRLPLNSSGKVDRRALPVPDAQAFGSQEYASPEGETEQFLTELWKELMHIDLVGRHDNFFELGGHSLQVMTLNAKLAQRFGIDFAATTVFQFPTIQELAQAVESLRLVNAGRGTSTVTEFEEGVL